MSNKENTETTEVKRYDHFFLPGGPGEGPGSTMDESDSGPYVKYADYSTTAADLARVKQENEELKEIGKSLVWFAETYGSSYLVYAKESIDKFTALTKHKGE